MPMAYSAAATFDVGKPAPGGSNIQPWQVHVITSAARDRLSAALMAAHESGAEARREYNYYPVNWRSPYIERRRATGWGLYSMRGIQKGDREGFVLHTCPQAALANYPAIVKAQLDIGEGQTLVCGMSSGYADLSAPVNQFQPQRRDLTDFVQYHRDQNRSLLPGLHSATVGAYPARLVLHIE